MSNSTAYTHVARNIYRRKGDGVLCVAVRGFCPVRRAFIDRRHPLPGATLDEARAAVHAFKAELAAGTYSEFSGRVLIPPSLAEFTEQLLADAATVRRRSTVEAQRYYAGMWLDSPLAALSVSAITYEHCADWARVLFRLATSEDGPSLNTALRGANELQRVMQAAVDRGYRLRGDNPMRTVARPRSEDIERPEHPTPAQVRALFEALRDYDDARCVPRSMRQPYTGVYPAFLLMWQLARRRDEVLNMRWDRIDNPPGEMGTIVWPTTKTRSVSLPLPPVYGELLDEHRDRLRAFGDHRAAASEWVFPTRVGKRYARSADHAKTAWAQATEAAGLVRYTPHNLRALGAVDIVDHSGERAARGVTDHKTIGAFQLYNRAREGDKLGALQAQAAALMASGLPLPDGARDGGDGDE